ncbi:MAG: GSCFA domain-containing protein [Saprospiraceae bacterium]|nr:GSCFA domain-containing protein [Saprospiraceae bacterium]
MTNQNFRTEIRISPGQFKIDHANTLLSIGSCFSEHIHERLKDAGFNSRCNPNGIVYNPISIGTQLLGLLSQRIWARRISYLIRDCIMEYTIMEIFRNF